MKKFYAFMMTLVMVLSVCVTAFAAGTGTGTITITNATVGDSYSIYKIFDATYSTDTNGNTNAVSYTIDEDNQFFPYMFSTNGAPATDNKFFSYDAATGAVTRVKGSQTTDIVNYLTTMVRSKDTDGTPAFEPDQTTEAASQTVAFTSLPYGYYLIDKGNGAAVTIDSNTPSVEVIDKNQKPAVDDSFKKLVWDENYDNGDGTSGAWVQSNSAGIGDIVKYKVEFTATNYDGEEQIQYYTIKDTKGSALWVEFNDITVTVDGENIGKGYYYCAGASSLNTGEWTAEKDADQWAETPEKANWFLIHRGYDEFDIVIPWMTNHGFIPDGNGFTLTYPENSGSKYSSPVEVEIKYTATIEPDATIGGGAASNNLWNTAALNWYSNTIGSPADPSTTQTIVYGMGLVKTDSDTKEYLAGAEFELYRDESCTTPVYVIPTDIEGVYMLDDLETIVSGSNRLSAREKYANYLEAYLGSNYATTQKNVVTSEINGKLVVLGLEAGTYYLKETKAPDGYNVLSAPVKVAVGKSNETFFVIADENGIVVNQLKATGGYIEHTYMLTKTEVLNSKGIELPSTGGEGTVRMITIGTIVALAFAVLLITHKKMTIYQD